METLLLAVLAISQAQPGSGGTDLAALARKCGSGISWISDGAVLVDNGWRNPILGYEHDRDPFFEAAKKEAEERKRLILWYCVRVPGAHMYRAQVLDQYIKSALFTDPGVVDLVRTKFVALRTCCDENLSAATGIKRYEFIEPGFVVMTPSGRIVHTLSPVRTFNTVWFRSLLIAVLRKHPGFNAPAGESVEDLIRGGDDETALAKASPNQKALIYRRTGRFEEVSGLECDSLHKGLALLGQGKLDDAARLLDPCADPEAIYARAVIAQWSGKDPEPLLREVAGRSPETPWGWRAASQLVRGRDGMPDGPLRYLVEDPFAAPDPGLATSTRRPAADLASTATRAVQFLLRSQRVDGSFADNRYTCWPDARNVPHVTTVATALAALALQEWREIDPQRVDDAVARAARFLADENNMDRRYGAYADAYRLLFFARTKDLPRARSAVVELARQQSEEGFWGHEYLNPFTTSVVVHSLVEAKRAGVDVPDVALRRAAAAIRRGRGTGATFAYNAERGPSSEKDSMSRKAVCELALLEAGEGDLDEVARGLDSFWKHFPRLEAVRTCDFHADGELAGFTFFPSVFHACEAALRLDDARKKAHLEKFAERILSIPELDGSFVDSHELGKSYGTALALLVLRRAGK